MSGIEDPGPPPELPEEYADVYREAYLRALAETGPIEAAPVETPRVPSRAERARAEKAARAERAREEKLRAAEERAERARLAQERAEQVRLEKLRAEQERAEQARVEKERVEQVRLENARAEKARVDAFRAEEARLAEERAAQARVVAQERAEQARVVAAELAEQTRLDRARDDEERAARAAAAPAAPAEPVVATPAPEVEPEPEPAPAPEPEPARRPQPQLDREVPAAPDDENANRNWLVVAAVAVVLIIAAYVAGDVISEDEPSSVGTSPVGAPTDPSVPRPSKEPARDPSTKPTAKVPPTTALGPLWDGDVEPVAIAGAEASCTAPTGVDSANQPVDYVAGNALDDDPSTAWRCNGQARNETITFTLPEGTEVGEVGLIPGYAKDDPSSGVDRYAENNRITKVRWIISDDVVFDQELDPDPTDRSVQTVRVPRTATGQVTLLIRSVERGDRNTTAISSVVISAAR